MEITVAEANQMASNSGAYSFTKKLGNGSFGTVFLAEEKKTQKKVAIKVIKVKASLTQLMLNKKPGQVKEGKREANMLFGLKHPNIVEVFQWYEFSGSWTKLRVRGLAIVTELCSNGSLEDYIQGNAPDVSTRINWYEQLSAGLAFIHEKSTAHRDIKPANILVTSDRVLKIADVGLAKAIWESKESDIDVNSTYESYMTSAAGTPLYMAPEVWLGHYDTKCDVFSMGLVFLMIAECPPQLTPFVPWKGNDINCLGMLLAREPETRDYDATKLLRTRHANYQERDLFNEMLKYRADDRPDMNKVSKKLKSMRRRKPPLGRRFEKEEDKSWNTIVIFGTIIAIAILAGYYYWS